MTAHLYRNACCTPATRYAHSDKKNGFPHIIKYNTHTHPVDWRKRNKKHYDTGKPVNHYYSVARCMLSVLVASIFHFR